MGSGAQMGPLEEELEEEPSLGEEEVFLFILKERKMEITVRSTSLQGVKIEKEVARQFSLKVKDHKR